MSHAANTQYLIPCKTLRPFHNIVNTLSYSYLFPNWAAAYRNKYFGLRNRETNRERNRGIRRIQEPVIHL